MCIRDSYWSVGCVSPCVSRILGGSTRHGPISGGDRHGPSGLPRLHADQCQPDRSWENRATTSRSGRITDGRPPEQLSAYDNDTRRRPESNDCLVVGSLNWIGWLMPPPVLALTRSTSTAVDAVEHGVGQSRRMRPRHEHLLVPERDTHPAGDALSARSAPDLWHAGFWGRGRAPKRASGDGGLAGRKSHGAGQSQW